MINLNNIIIILKRNSYIILIASSIFVISLLVSVIFITSFLNISWESPSNNPLFFLIIKKNKKYIFYNLLKNNLLVVSITILGSLTMSFSTILELVVNGMQIGVLLSLITNQNFFIVLILPHAIFEVPAIIIAGAAGFKIPYEIVRYLAGKKEQPLTKEDVKEYFTLALISIILIVIAAFVEAYVTPKIAEYFLSNLN